MSILIFNHGAVKDLSLNIVTGVAVPTGSAGKLWCNTATSAGKWMFSVSAPSSPAMGDIWIQIDATSTTTINLLRRNGIVINLCVVKQWSGSAWTPLAAYYHNGSVWTQVSYAYDEYTYLLLHMDGATGDTSFADSSRFNRSVTANGNVCKAAGSGKFGTASAIFDGNSDYLSVPGITIGTGAFTVDFWVFVTTANHANCVFSYGGSNTGFAIYTDHSNAAFNYVCLYDGAVRMSSSPLAAGAWHHIALVGNGGAAGSRNMKLYLDGVQSGVTYTVDYNLTKTVWIGANESAATESLLGYLDEVRFSIGVQRWTGNFVPPITPYSM